MRALFPLLGSRDNDYLSFQYLPIQISQGCKIAIPNWVVNRGQLRKSDIIDLHSTYCLASQFFNIAQISATYWDKELNADVYELELKDSSERKSPLIYLIDTEEIISTNPDLNDQLLLQQILKDCMLLKKGVLIYLKHLIPYFSRISRFGKKEYAALKDLVWSDIQKQVEANIDYLVALHEKSSDGTLSVEQLDLEEIRGKIESELYIELFRITFDVEAPLPYLVAIKDLEKQLYWNYNSAVLLYSKKL